MPKHCLDPLPKEYMYLRNGAESDCSQRSGWKDLGEGKTSGFQWMRGIDMLAGI